ncbi:MAG: hypothetical protein OXG79_12455 [Chloroflexi bacterium]|nr:hypothetical protein [Chloroflexota bacterium]
MACDQLARVCVLVLEWLLVTLVAAAILSLVIGSCMRAACG